MFRKTIFWMHLACGIVAGIAVFTMSFTGVALTYKRQIEQWVAEQRYVPEAEQGQALPLEQLLALQQRQQPGVEAATVVITNDPGAPVNIRAGRQGTLNLNPYNGEAMQLDSPRLTAFFAWNTGFHRWFNVEGENRDIARQITGISNVLFFFLVVSGMYLWLPAVWKWALFKARLAFRSGYPDSKARDFHWHHIFGIWAAIPLLAVVYTGGVISYPWVANLMYMAFGAEPPPPAGPPGGAGGGGPGQGQNPGGRELAMAQDGSANPALQFLPLNALVDTAIAQTGGDWNRLNVTLPRGADPAIQIEVDPGNGAQAHKRYTLSIDRGTGAVTGMRTFADQPEATRLRGISRFLHTGEVLGFWGQTLAGLASFAALFGVYTGFALSYRRLIQPLFRKKK
jgi:uncharacterized iron-regulated membrane protein